MAGGADDHSLNAILWLGAGISGEAAASLGYGFHGRFRARLPVIAERSPGYVELGLIPNSSHLPKQAEEPAAKPSWESQVVVCYHPNGKEVVGSREEMCLVAGGVVRVLCVVCVVCMGASCARWFWWTLLLW